MPTPVFEEAAPSQTPTRPNTGKTDFASLLSRVYVLANAAITQLEMNNYDESHVKALTNHISALNKMARILPLLNEAERLAEVRDAHGKKIEDLSDAELEKQIIEIERRKAQHI